MLCVVLIQVGPGPHSDTNITLHLFPKKNTFVMGLVLLCVQVSILKIDFRKNQNLGYRIYLYFVMVL